MSLFTTSQVRCFDAGCVTHKPGTPPLLIQTGIGFLDHMIDQINSHAQVSVGMTVHHHVDLASLTSNASHDNHHRDTTTNGGDNGKDHQSENPEVAYEDHNRLAECNQSSLLKHVGWTLGSQLALLPKFLGIEEDYSSSSSPNNIATNTARVMPTSRFCCPLDEALVECILTKPPTTSQKRRKLMHNHHDNTTHVDVDDDGTNDNSAGIAAVTIGDKDEILPSASNSSREGGLVQYDLPPFGIYPKGKGRSHIGKLQTSALEEFWKALGKSSGMEISLVKVRGHNGHHIVEASFKAFSRAFRNLLDSTDTKEDLLLNAQYQQAMWGITSENWKSSLALQRMGSMERSTKETRIQVQLALDGGAAGIRVKTGIQTLDDFFTTLAQQACASLRIECTGDLWVDDHHTAEDVAIAVGQVLTQALGSKAGLNRMWCAQQMIQPTHVAMNSDNGNGEDDNNNNSNGNTGQSSQQPHQVIEVTMDLSNRPCLTHNLALGESGEEMVGDLSVEMFEHVLESLVVNGRMTVHILQTPHSIAEDGTTGTVTLQDKAMATAAAFGKALKYCAMVDSRRAGKTASSKGTLSV